MTTGQKENIKRLKAVQVEAKKLKALNPKLKHTEAVKKAFEKINGKVTKVKKVTKKLPLKVAAVKIKKKVKQTGKTNILIDKTKQAKKPGKRVSVNDKVYYESRANRSDKGRLLGIVINTNDLVNKNVLEDLKYTSQRITLFENQIINYNLAIKNKENKQNIPILKKQLVGIKKYNLELKQHIKELKKLI